MPVETLDDVEKRVADLLDSAVSAARIILVEEHPDYPGHLGLEPLDETARGLFYAQYSDWMSRHLILNELHLADTLTARLTADGYYVIWMPSTAAIRADIDRWSAPLHIEGYQFRPFQQFSLNRALERARTGATAPDRFWFWNWSAGAGKSFCSGAAAKALFDSGDIDLVIACTLSKLKENLRRTFVAPAGLDAVVNDGPKPKRAKGYQAGHQVYVMNYEKLWHDEALIEPLVAGRRVLWVLDEALALDTPVLTRDRGWQTVESVAAGDWVPGSKGWVEVVRKTDVWTDKPCYRVTTQDGGEVVCSKNHAWTVCSGRDGDELLTVNTAELGLMIRLAESGWSRRPVRIAIPQGVEFDHASLDLDPYVLGYWLGDGVTGCPTVVVGDEDREALERELQSRGFTTKRTGKVLYVSRPEANPRNGKSFRASLLGAGVLNDKHVPRRYLESSREQRLELLRGLMDSDGYCSARGDAAVYTQRPGRLMDDVEHLVRSLGYSPQRRILPRSGFDTNTPAHQLTWLPVVGENPFSLARKASRVRAVDRVASKKVVSVEPVVEVPVQCLEVDSPDHLFAVGKTWVLTHNCHKLITAAGQNKSRQALDRLTRMAHSIVWPMSATVVGGNPLRYRDVFSLDGHPTRNPLSTKTDFIARYADRVRDVPIMSKNGRQASFVVYDWNLDELQEVRHRVGDRTMAVRKTDPGVREQFKGIETLPVQVQPTPATTELLDLITNQARAANRAGEGLAPYYMLARIACINPEALRHSSSPEAAAIVAAHPDLIDAAHSAKIEVLNDLLDGIREAQDKAVVFCHWNDLGLIPLARHLRVPHVLHHGAQTAVESQDAQDRFKADPDITAFCSSDAGTHGLNLQEARYVVNVDPTYSYDDLAQRNARIDRADSHLDGLTAYVLITEGSVEERVWETCQARRRLAATVQGTSEELSYGSDRVSLNESANLAWLLGLEE